LAVDAYPPRAHPRRSDDTPGMRLGNRWFESYWPTEVVRMDAAAASSYHSNRTLLMVWPPIDDMADRALRLYRGDHVIYVGEISPACANDAFFEQLGAEWKEIDEVPVPQWENIHDEMIVYRRTNDAG
ncbi:MAG: hypothetical protein ACREQ5_15150, partial [Candidatus Dormibacteria bacterium]